MLIDSLAEKGVDDWVKKWGEGGGAFAICIKYCVEITRKYGNGVSSCVKEGKEKEKEKEKKGVFLEPNHLYL